MSGVAQQRKNKPATPNVVVDGDSNGKSKINNSSDSSSTTSWSSVLRVVALLLLGAAMGYFVKSMDASNGIGGKANAVKKSNVRVVSLDELAQHAAATNDKAIWLSILGEVFDVSTGGSYKKGGGYDFFTGRDGSAAFVTGKFDDEGLIADVTALEPSQVLEVWEWIDFYRKHETYKKVGVLNDVYYDSNGERTDKYREMRRLADEGKKVKAAEEELRRIWPGCNMRSSPAEGRMFWCEDGSGGVKGRGWDGYPREFAQRQKNGEFAKRCVCAPKEKLDHPQLRVYINCDPNSHSCSFPPTQDEI